MASRIFEVKLMGYLETSWPIKKRKKFNFPTLHLIKIPVQNYFQLLEANQIKGLEIAPTLVLNDLKKFP